MSQLCLVTAGVPAPRALSVSVRFCPCIASFAYVIVFEPENRFPPSRGITFTRTPELSASAVAPDVSMASSCTVPLLTV